MSVLPIEEPRGRLESSSPAPFSNRRSASTPPDRFEPYSDYLRSQGSLKMDTRASLTEQNLRLFSLAQISTLTPHDYMSRSTSPVSTMSSRESSKGRISYTKPEFRYELERRNIFVSKTFPPDWDHISQVVNHGAERELNTPADQIFEAQYLLLDASNQATVVAEVVPKLLPMQSLLLSSSYEGIYDALWRVQDIPTCDGANTRLASPKPDVTVGYNRRFLGCNKAIDFLSTRATPVICMPKLAFPIFTLEAKGLESTGFSARQNMHNSACMLSNLCYLRKLVKHDYENLVVFSASVSPEKVSLHAHWVEESQNQVIYPSKEIRTWSPGSDNLKSTVRAFSNIIYEALACHEKWIRQDLRKLEIALEQPSGFVPPP